MNAINILSRYLSVLCIAAVLCTLPRGLNAGESTLTLSEALLLLYHESPILNAARAAARNNAENIIQAQGAWKPSISTSIKGARVNSLSQATGSTSAGTNVLTQRSLGISVVQNLYNGGSDEANIAATESSQQSSQYTLEITEQDTLLQGGTIYSALLRDQQRYRLSVENVNRLESLLQGTKDLFSVGQATITEVSQADSRLSQGKANLRSAQGQLDSSKAVFKQIIGQDASGLVLPKFNVGSASDIDSAIEIAQHENPSIKLGQSRVTTSKKLLARAKGDLLPNLDVTFSATRSYATSASKDRSKVFTLSSDLNIPLYQKGIEKSEIRQAKELVVQREYELEQTKRTLESSVLSAWHQLQANNAAVQSYKSSLASAAQALEGARQENLVGKRTLLDVLNSEQDFRDADLNLQDALHHQFISKLNLMRSLGQLNLENLQAALDASVN